MTKDLLLGQPECLKGKTWLFGWRTVYPERTGNVVAGPGVYVVYVNGRVWYVGSTANLNRRFEKHEFLGRRSGTKPRYSSGDKVWIKYKECYRYGSWLMIELRLIKRLRPMFNVRDNPNRPSAQ